MNTLEKIECFGGPYDGRIIHHYDIQPSLFPELVSVNDAPYRLVDDRLVYNGLTRNPVW